MSSFIVTAENRRDLVTSIDMALIAGGSRISKGDYEVSIRRLTKAEVLARANLETVRAINAAKCAKNEHRDSGTGECTHCGQKL